MMKTSELIKLKVGQHFIFRQPEGKGEQICLVTDAYSDGHSHTIHYEWEDGGIGAAAIEVYLPVGENDQLENLRSYEHVPGCSPPHSRAAFRIIR